MINCPNCLATYPNYKDTDSGIDYDKEECDYKFECKCGYSETIIFQRKR